MRLSILSAIAQMFGIGHAAAPIAHNARPNPDKFRPSLKPWQKALQRTTGLRPAVKVNRIIGATPCGRHYWLDTNYGRIRKPAGTFALPKEG